jgi:hypothetical protein
MRFSYADAAQIDEVRPVFAKAEATVMLHLEAGNLGGPVPAKLLQSCDDRQACLANAMVGRAVAPQVRLAFEESGQVRHMGPLRARRLGGQCAIVLCDKGARQVPERVIDIARGPGPGLRLFAVLHGVSLLCLVDCGRRGSVINAEVRGVQPDLEEVLAPGPR